MLSHARRSGTHAAGSRRLRRQAGLLCVPLLFALASAACGTQDAAPDLSSAVDSLMPRLEVLAGLPARAQVRMARRDREELRAYVAEQLAQELPPEELEGIEASYQAFGLIPDTLDLQRLLLDLYTEQVIGYYDPETQTLYVMEGVAPDALRPVLAHELVHALQDQYVDLDSLISRERTNDRQTAAQAAIEGHATLVMLALLAEERLGAPLNVRALPDLGEQLGPTLRTQNEQFPVFRSAPRVIQEMLLFPYLRGAVFVQALWRTGATSSLAGVGGEYPPPLGNLLPLSTEQVLHPETRFLEERRDAPTILELEPSPIGPVAGTGRGRAEGEPAWRTLYENVLGEFETRILLGEHLGPAAEPLADGWDGDRYRMLEAPSGERALVWYSVWDDVTAADDFAAGYRRILVQREGRHGRVDRLELEGRPAVRVVEAQRGVDLERLAIPKVAELSVVEP